MPFRFSISPTLLWMFVAVVFPTPLVAQGNAELSASVRVLVLDQIGARLPAEVTLIDSDGVVVSGTTDATGERIFTDLMPGRYHVEASSQGFQTAVSPSTFVGAGGQGLLEVTLHVGPLEQHVLVTPAAVELPEGRVGSPVSVVDRRLIDDLSKVDVHEALRTVPGVQVLQTGARGGTTNLFVRGGEADFNKVLIDGIPANDIGGAFDFGTFGVTGVERVEVLRSANSVLYGADALSGVVELSTPRGRTPEPALTYSVDGGNLGTFRHELSVGGVVDRVDYFLAFSQFDTDNELPNNAFHNDTLVGRVGMALGSSTDLSVTFRRVDTDFGLPGPTGFTGVADDSTQTGDLTFVGVTARSRLSDRMVGTFQFASSDQTVSFVNHAPTGEPFDPFGFGVNYIGNLVTIDGANGFSTSGRAILDFGGVYPSVFDSDTSRRSLFGTVDYALTDRVDVSGGARFEHEEGVSGTTATTERTNAGAFVEGRASLTERLHLIGGIGYDHNEFFGGAATPRVSVAYYLQLPEDAAALMGETKLTFNIGKGVKAPSVFDEQSSLLRLLEASPDGAALIAGLGIDGIRPERSRSLDVGIEQALWGHRARLRAAFFDNEFSDLIQFVAQGILPEVGVPRDVALAVPFGATVNAGAYRARGLETSGEVSLFGERLWLGGGYTFVDAEVTESFAGSARAPSRNPAFPDIEIGAFAPLVGARPFRRPTHFGNLLVRVVQGPAQIAVSGYFVGKSDDSTFLFDQFFGTSLLLPNRDLTAGYHKVDLSGSYRLHPRVRWYGSVENLSDERYQAAAGFPALGRTFRTGVAVGIGGGAAGRP